MERLILFDVDGTLVNCPPDTAPVAAIRHLYGLEVSFEGMRTGGMTEPQILALLLQSAGWDDTKIKAELPNLMKEVVPFIHEAFEKGTIRLVPGVKNLLDQLEHRGVTLGLITGNRKSLARLKLEDVNIWDYFSVGGYGDDPHEKRSDLVQLACERANFRTDNPGVYVIGDTWRDIKAAVDAGVTNRVGLIGPRHPRQEFKEAGANIILSSFADTQKVLGALNIPSV
ncbi:hypothetical protein A3D71_02040 [Candidatus Kaiserbacteria bacterium RIFCSPHIGHO2_02_FULL_55_20]|uniref:Haloacid dehalogenase n=1 Tax=Candidatus Kaiserbacteria bacterium RIFCSPHIGHO2_02_FULL_55_20 TaxID=1798497 RepID=A0A1F6DX36_9BACT|nr:MAG: hypothetical protein A2680_02900 [Candidatus Kaiserbacteria bacterium RIFCSPHIGHO2_01_FULL_55_37]OGG65978.1 MAG: hypothetical protein A3D71_02040 [Candidatus Kaiserbacteria bacterium RIFCSPHIGHO2_02_FULL_55_20]